MNDEKDKLFGAEIRAGKMLHGFEELAHYRTKGSKNGISTTEGYKAIGEKAKGIINSAGNYIYNTGNKIGTTLGTATNKVTSSTTDIAKKISSAAASYLKKLTGTDSSSLAKQKEAYEENEAAASSGDNVTSTKLAILRRQQAAERDAAESSGETGSKVKTSNAAEREAEEEAAASSGETGSKVKTSNAAEREAEEEAAASSGETGSKVKTKSDATKDAEDEEEAAASSGETGSKVKTTSDERESAESSGEITKLESPLSKLDKNARTIPDSVIEEAQAYSAQKSEELLKSRLSEALKSGTYINTEIKRVINNAGGINGLNYKVYQEVYYDTIESEENILGGSAAKYLDGADELYWAIRKGAIEYEEKGVAYIEEIFKKVYDEMEEAEEEAAAASSGETKKNKY